MIEFNGRTFAKNDAEFVASLFNSGGTCSGFYKRRKDGIALYDMQNNPRVFLVSNKFGERFSVSMTRNSAGKLFYMHGLSESDALFVGTDTLGYAEEKTLLNALFDNGCSKP